MKPIILFHWALTTVASVLAFNVQDRDAIRDYEPIVERDLADLWKRRGGGGSGGRGGGSSSGGSSGGSNPGSSSSGGRGPSSSSSGGRTITGSGVRPSYGGGTYYGGGATVPYRAGATSASGISPFLVGAGLGLAFWPGLWLHGAYLYPYSHPYSFYNRSSNQNETKPVICGCDETEECGCDENSNSTYMNDLIGNSSYSGLNQTLVTVADVNGTSTILVNGTLPNGTTASGGTDDLNAGAGLQALLQTAGWWPMVATVVALVFVL